MDKKLSNDASEAIRQILAQVRKIVLLLEGEGNSVAMNDTVTLSISEKDKPQLVADYDDMVNEFMAKPDKWKKTADTALRDELIEAQKKMRHLADMNNERLDYVIKSFQKQLKEVR